MSATGAARVTVRAKTFTMAQIIAKTQRPALILHQKTLAASALWRVKSFFQQWAWSISSPTTTTTSPKAYVPRTDT